MKFAMTSSRNACRAWLLAAALSAGCGQQATQNLAPVEITRSTACSLDGMILSDYPGPKAQIHYADQPAPDYFCDLVELFNTILKPEQSRKVLAIYVQDMGQTEWDNPQGHWIDARTAYFVTGSSKTGSMGPTLGSFAQEGDARKFVAANGGRILKFTEISADMVALDGGALHDQPM